MTAKIATAQVEQSLQFFDGNVTGQENQKSQEKVRNKKTRSGKSRKVGENGSKVSKIFYFDLSI